MYRDFTMIHSLHSSPIWADRHVSKPFFIRQIRLPWPPYPFRLSSRGASRMFLLIKYPHLFRKLLQPGLHPLELAPPKKKRTRRPKRTCSSDAHILPSKKSTPPLPKPCHPSPLSSGLRLEHRVQTIDGSQSPHRRLASLFQCPRRGMKPSTRATTIETKDWGDITTFPAWSFNF